MQPRPPGDPNVPQYRPTYQQPTVGPGWYPPPGPPAPPPPKRKLPRVIVLGVVLGVGVGLVGAFGIKALSSSGSATPPEAQSAPEPPRVDLLTETFEREPAPDYGGQPTMDACALLKPDDLDEIGIPIRYPISIQHSYIEEAADGPNMVRDQTSEPASACSYQVVGPAEEVVNYVSVEFRTVPFNTGPSTTVFGYISEKRTVNGLDVYTTADGESWSAEIPLGENARVEVRQSGLAPSYEGTPTEKLLDRVVDVVAGNVANGNTGLQGYRYEAPYGDGIGPCGVFTAGAFEQLTGKRDSGLVTEARPTYEFKILNSAKGPYTYLESKCERRDPERLSTTGEGVLKTATVTQYENAAQAAAHDAGCSGDIGDVVDLGPGLGDGTSCIATLTSTSSVVFRSGNVGVEVDGLSGSPDEMRDQAVRVGRKILEDMHQ